MVVSKIADPEIELVDFARVAIVQRREIEYRRFGPGIFGSPFGNAFGSMILAID